jgi:hypothetical protein
MLDQAPHHLIPYSLLWTGAGLLLTALLSVCGFVLKNGIAAMKDNWDGAMTKLDTINETTRVMTDNHFSHLQEEVGKQTGLLETLVKEQIDTNKALAETNGYIRAWVDLKK